MEYNVFNAIHKVLRTVMYETALCIQTASFEDRKQCEAALQELKHMLGLFAICADHEEKIIFPLVKKHRFELFDYFKREHAKIEYLMNKLCSQIGFYEVAMDADCKSASGLRIFYTLTDFVSITLEHLNKEEIVISKTLAKYYGCDQLTAIAQRFMGGIVLADMFKHCRMILRAVNNQDVVEWYTLICGVASDEQKEEIWKLVQDELPADRLQKLSDIFL